jgi:hypothetical protein
VVGGTHSFYRAYPGYPMATRYPTLHAPRRGTGTWGAVIGAGVNALATVGTMWMQYDAARIRRKRAEHEREREAARQAEAAAQQAAAQAAAQQAMLEQQAQQEALLASGGGAAATGAAAAPADDGKMFQVALVAIPVVLGAIMSR